MKHFYITQITFFFMCYRTKLVETHLSVVYLFITFQKVLKTVEIYDARKVLLFIFLVQDLRSVN